MLFTRLAQTLHGVIRRPSRINYRPVYMQVESTNYCNLHCTFCQRDNIESKFEHMDPAKLEKILDEFKPRFLNLGGDGEPLLNPHVGELISLAKARGCTVNFASNGTVLGKVADKLIDSELDLLKISIDASTPETYQKIRNSDDHEKIVNNIRLLQERKKERGVTKPKLRFNVVVCSENVHELADIASLAHELGVPTINYKTLDVVGQEEGCEDIAEGVVNDDRLLDNYKIALERAKTLKVSTNLEYLIRRYDDYKVRYSMENVRDGNLDRKVHCMIPWISTYVKVNGDLAPCCPFALGYVNASLGNIERDGVDGALNSEAYMKFRDEMRRGEPESKFCRFCMEAQTVENYAVNAKMLSGFWR